MTLPNPYYPGTTYMLTRRTSERRFFLKPDATTTSTLLFTLATYATKHSIKVHSFVFMSNHIHLVVTDVKGNLPDFTRDFYSSSARVINRRLGRRESFWATGEGGVTTLLTEQTLVEKCAYVITNPVAAGIVPTHSRWRLSNTKANTPLVSTMNAIASRKNFKLKRPCIYFKSKNSALAVNAMLVLEPPPGMDEEQFERAVSQAVREREEAIQAERFMSKLPFIGMENAIATDVKAKPATNTERSRLNPRIACSDSRLMAQAKIRLKEFRRAYRRCLAILKAGHPILFPEGTYAIQRRLDIKTTSLEDVLILLSSS